MDYIFGRNPVLEALRAGRPVNKIYLAKNASQAPVKEIIAAAKNKHIPLQFAERKQLDYISGGKNHQGVIAQALAKEYADWEEVLDGVVRVGGIPLFVLLDGIEDPGNMGAILRTADASGVHCIIIPRHRAVPLTAGVAKASAGAIEYVPVAQVTSLSRVIDALKEKGFWIIGTDYEAREEHYRVDLKGPLALVLGSENKGIGRLVKEKCDFLVRIPMYGRINSLNVSAAAAILLYEIIRQRNTE